MKMTAIATKESNVSALIDNIIWKVQAKGVCNLYSYTLTQDLVPITNFFLG